MTEIIKEKRGKGKPTKYKDDMGKRMIEFFDRKPYETKEIYDEDGNQRDIRIANDFPSFEGFAASVNVSRPTIYTWKKKHKSFRIAWRRCEAMQHNFIMVNGMAGLTAQAFTIFAAKNIMGWRDKQDVNNTGETTVRTIIIDSVDAEL